MIESVLEREAEIKATPGSGDKLIRKSGKKRTENTHQKTKSE